MNKNIFYHFLSAVKFEIDSMSALFLTFSSPCEVASIPVCFCMASLIPPGGKVLFIPAFACAADAPNFGVYGLSSSSSGM